MQHTSLQNNLYCIVSASEHTHSKVNQHRSVSKTHEARLYGVFALLCSEAESSTGARVWACLPGAPAVCKRHQPGAHWAKFRASASYKWNIAQLTLSQLSSLSLSLGLFMKPAHGGRP